MTKDISFGSFNLYNLQLPGEPWRTARPYTQVEYDAKIAWTAGMLRAMATDVFAFQELWSAQCLVDAFRAAGMDKDYELVFLREGPNPTWYDIAVALAVRRTWTVKARQVHKTFPPELHLTKRPTKGGEDDDVRVAIGQFSRSVIQLTIGQPDVPDVDVLAVHLKSKLATRLDDAEAGDDAVKPHARAIGMALSTIRRTAEAAALRVILTKLMKGNDRAVAVLGDYNDGPLSNTLSIASDQPPFRLSFASRTGSRSDVGLYAAGAMEDQQAFRDVQYTHEFDGMLDSLDHILVSEQFYNHSEKRIWSFVKTRVWNDHIEDTDKATSDHGQVAAWFRFNPRQQRR